ncbi:MAG TPA: hypothetical protein PLX79_01450 [Candidatus Dojkabacteria bacterium]|mgnify:CR=1 FL=1|nr:hypothetical protein [Candidatus Dojkabacteria bacterium]
MSSGHSERVGTPPITAGVTTGLLKSIGMGDITSAMNNGFESVCDSFFVDDQAATWNQPTVQVDGGEKNGPRNQIIAGRNQEEPAMGEPEYVADVKVVTLSVPPEVQAQDPIVQSELFLKVSVGEYGPDAKIVDRDTVVFSREDVGSLGISPNSDDTNNPYVKARVTSDGSYEYYTVLTLNGLSYIIPSEIGEEQVSGNSLTYQLVRYLAQREYDPNSVGVGYASQLLESLTAERNEGENNLSFSESNSLPAGEGIIPLMVGDGTYYFDTKEQQVTLRTEAGISITMNYGLFGMFYSEVSDGSFVSPNMAIGEIINYIDSLDEQNRNAILEQLGFSTMPLVVEKGGFSTYQSFLESIFPDKMRRLSGTGYPSDSRIVLPASYRLLFNLDGLSSTKTFEIPNEGALVFLSAKDAQSTLESLFGRDVSILLMNCMPDIESSSCLKKSEWEEILDNQIDIKQDVYLWNGEIPAISGSIEFSGLEAEDGKKRTVTLVPSSGGGYLIIIK